VFSTIGTTPEPNDNVADAYHLNVPDIAEARDAIYRLYGAAADELWKTLLSRARVSGNETDRGAFDRLLAVMFDADPVTALCARSLKIRADTHTHLTAVHALIRAAE
jgi:hypothetical protein